MNVPVGPERSVRRVLSDLSLLGASEVDAGVRLLLSGMADVMGAAGAWFLLTRRDLDSTPGWSPFTMSYLNPSAEHDDVVRRWFKERDLSDSPSVLAVVQGAGSVRVLRVKAEVPPERWAGSFTQRDLARLGLQDRIVGGLPVTEEVEVYLGLDRADADFEPADEAPMRDALEGLERLARWFALSYGLGTPGPALSPRERDVLLGLLTGASEKVLAAERGLRPSYLHQVVVRIYRKFEVASRAELMALWLGDARGDAPPSERTGTYP